MTAPVDAGLSLQELTGASLGSVAQAEGRPLPPHRAGITRSALDALERINDRTRLALASTADRTGSRHKEA